jgi:Ni/Co efflux regulator RcnB
MKSLLLASVLSLALPVAAWAQTEAPAATSKAPVKKHVTKKSTSSTKKKATVRKHVPAHKLKRSAVKAVEEVTPVNPDAGVTLTPGDLEVAKEVYLGSIKCELGENVFITADAVHPGFFDVQVKKMHYRMHPVESRTGAIRLEDPKAGAVWIQLGNKSMLMNQKIGERVADECRSPQQVITTEEMKEHPVKGLLD